MPEPKLEEIRLITAFFAHPSAALVELKAPVRVGDMIYIKGHTTDFQQRVESMQVDRQDVQEAQAGQSIGLKVNDRCRKRDVVYKLAG